MPIGELVQTEGLNVKQLTLPEIPGNAEANFPFGITMPPEIKEKMLKDVDYLIKLDGIGNYSLYTLIYYPAVSHFFPEIRENEKIWTKIEDIILDQPEIASGLVKFEEATTYLVNAKLLNPGKFIETGFLSQEEFNELYESFDKFRKEKFNQKENPTFILAGYVDFMILGHPNAKTFNPEMIWEEVDGDKIARQTINRSLNLEPIGNISPLIDLKILSPSLFKKLNILNNEEFARKMREKLRRIMDNPYDRAQYDSELPVFYYYMRILAADDVKITENGLELIWNNKVKVLETPIPEERSF